ncbi:MAG: hypothetical protein OEV43_05705 [Coriobacteriia bacterium]|nr:hypothetical protein [Coriobacteriia bacterium]
MYSESSAVWRRFRRQGVITQLVFVVAVIVTLAVCACDGSKEEVGQTSSVEGAAQDILLVRDGRHLCDLATVSGSCRNDFDLGGEVEAVVVSQNTPRVAAFEVIALGRRELRLLDLDSGVQREVARDVAQTVGFDGEGSLYYVSQPQGGVGELIRHDSAVDSESVVAACALEAIADSESSAAAYVAAVSDVGVDPIDSRAFFLAAAGRDAVAIDSFKGGRFCDLVAVTPRAVVYVDNKGAGETHGHVQVFDVDAGESRSVALGARVVAVSRDRDALLLAKFSLSGDTQAEDDDIPASNVEQLYLVRLDGARPLGLEPVGKPISDAGIQAVFLESEEVVVVAVNRPDGNDDVVAHDLATGQSEVLLGTEHEAVKDLCSVPEDGEVVCVLSRLDDGGAAWSDSVVVLPVLEPDAGTPSRIQADPPGALHLVGWVRSTLGNEGG